MGILLSIGILLSYVSFVSDNKEFFDTTSEQIDRGYEWEFVGHTIDDNSVPSLSLKSMSAEPFYLFQLKKEWYCMLKVYFVTALILSPTVTGWMQYTKGYSTLDACAMHIKSRKENIIYSIIKTYGNVAIKGITCMTYKEAAELNSKLGHWILCYKHWEKYGCGWGVIDDYVKLNIHQSSEIGKMKHKFLTLLKQSGAKTALMFILFIFVFFIILATVWYPDLFTKLLLI